MVSSAIAPLGCQPSFDELRALARRGNLVPIYRELVADTETPVSAYAKLGRRPGSFLLESATGGAKWAAYSFLGVEPRAFLRAEGGRVEVRWRDLEGGGVDRTATWETGDPAIALKEILGELSPAAPDGLPRFFGGAVGYLGWDVARAWERLPAKAPRAPALATLPDAELVVSDLLLVFDHLRKTLKVLATAFVPHRPDEEPREDRRRIAYDKACDRVAAACRALAGPTPPLRPLPPPSALAPLAAPSSEIPREAYLAAAARAKEQILAGEIFQIVLSQRFSAPRGDVDPFDVYRALRVLNPSPYLFHLELPGATVTGASPETLVRLEEGVVELRPIAGTRPRGASRDEDERLARELAADPKERAEHVMLIDLGRNDVGRIAEAGSVVVDEVMAVERYSHVMHLVSNVRGRLRAGLGPFDVLRATFPAGTLSGAPKIRAIELIDELEPTRRGLYGGAVGYISFSGNLDLAIAIRTVLARGDRFYVQAGAGIVHDSEPAREHEECVSKARAGLRAIAMAGADGGETA